MAANHSLSGLHQNHTGISTATNRTSTTFNHSSTTAAEITVAVVLTLFNAATIAGNVLVLLSILINKKLRTVTNSFLVSLATADLALAIAVVPFSSYLHIEKSWIFGETFCTFWAAIDVLCCTASIYSLCAISMDRYIGVTRPMRHRNIMSRKRTTLLILFIWILSVGISIGPLLGWRNSNGADSLDTCTLTMNTGYVLFSATSSFYIPAIITVAIYTKIYKAAAAQTKFLSTGIKPTRTNGSSSQILLRAHSRRTIQQYMQCRPGDGGTASSLPHKYSSEHTTFKHAKRELSTDNPEIGVDSNGNSPAKWKQDTMARHTDGDASLATRISKFNKEKKAAKTLGIVMGVFLICWLPFFITLPLDSLCTQCQIPPVAFDLAFWLGYCNSMLNPIIYAVWNPEFRRTFKALLKCLPCRYKSLRYALVFGQEVPGKKPSTTSSRSCNRDM